MNNIIYYTLFISFIVVIMCGYVINESKKKNSTKYEDRLQYKYDFLKLNIGIEHEEIINFLFYMYQFSRRLEKLYDELVYSIEQFISIYEKMDAIDQEYSILLSHKELILNKVEAFKLHYVGSDELFYKHRMVIEDILDRVYINKIRDKIVHNKNYNVHSLVINDYVKAFNDDVDNIGNY